MKRIILLPAILLAITTIAQSSVTGNWQGNLNAGGVDLRIIFRIASDAAGNLTAKFDCPDQGLKDIDAGAPIVHDDSIRINIAQFQASYAGRLTNDSVITGQFTQGAPFPLLLKKVKNLTAKNRPQTPVGPFPYKSEDIVYSSKDGAIQYGATITIPQGAGPFPAALLITGSGQQNRDEEILEHKPFAVLADYLTRNGYVVLRVDDRGIGQTTGNPLTATTADFAADATVSLQYLLARKEVNPKKVGLIGHSEGGMIAQMMAADNPSIRFVIMMAGPGEKNDQLMLHQIAAMLSKTDLPPAYIDAYLKLYASIIAGFADSAKQPLPEHISQSVNDWLLTTPDSIVSATTGMGHGITKEKFIGAFEQQLGSPWFRYFLQYDPAPNLKKITGSVLALNGSEDVQVIAATNLPAIRTALQQGKARSYTVTELKGLNHLFQQCSKCTINEYGSLEQTIAPVALDTMVRWLKKELP